MNLRKKMFDQLVGRLKGISGMNYIAYVWNFVDGEINDPNFENESNYEIASHYLKSGNPLLIDTELKETVELIIKKYEDQLSKRGHK